MDNGRQHTTGFVFGSFMIAAVVVAMLPTRERQLYQYDCHESGGLVTQLVGFPTIERSRTRTASAEHRDPYDLRQCWPERGLIAGRILSPDEEFANTPTYRMVRTMERTGSTVEALRRRPASGAARTLAPRTMPSTGEQAVALLPDEPGAQGGGTAPANAPRLAALSPSAGPFPGGLATAPFGPGPGAGGFAPPGETPPTGGTDPIGETPGPTPTPSPTPSPSPSATPTPTPTGTSTPPVVIPPSAAVPEPATWLMMILGFFTIGAALRVRVADRRRKALPAWGPKP